MSINVGECVGLGFFSTKLGVKAEKEENDYSY